MTMTLGKRKRAQTSHRAEQSSDSSEDDREELQDIFRRAFEKKFKPLSTETRIKRSQPRELDTQDIAQDETDWDGVDSDDEKAAAVQVVEVNDIHNADEVSKSELKAFMRSKPPLAASTTTTATPKKSAATTDREDEKSESLNLKNDLALHRLISESHLLSATPSSNHRSKVLDMRLQALGSKNSMLKQENMPMSHRKGIVAKVAEKEQRRRKDAKENGIILEKEKHAKSKSQVRLRGVGGPSIGKFKGGTLTLSKRDVSDITGPRRGGLSKKKGKK